MNGSTVKRLSIALGLTALAAIASCKRAAPAPPLILATTTSVGNSGLLDVIVAPYRESSRMEVRSQLVGSGLALKMVADGHADVVISHAGMGSTLRAASATGAYTLTDRATLTQLRDALQLKVLFEGGPLLLNTYAVVFDPAGHRAKDAAAFAEWLSDGGGRQRIQDYRIGGSQAFRIWPKGKARSKPEDAPF